MEIERKFVVERPPDELERAPSRRIEQGYVAVDDRAEVRLRRYGDARSLTLKSTGGLARVEEEFDVDEQQFESLWPLTEGRRVEKTRYVLEGGVEVDVYDGALAGLVVAEVEFPSEEAAAAFEPPEWFGAEVTEDSRYKNRSLALEGMPA